MPRIYPDYTDTTESKLLVFVCDMKRSVSFYRDVLGLPPKFESPGWTEFATEGATLALHLAEGAVAAKEEGVALNAFPPIPICARTAGAR